MKKAVIYARYSSGSQTEQSIEGQLRVCKRFAEENGFIILDEYIDRAKTARNDNRPAFQKMLADSIEKAWAYVIVYAVDRFARDDGDYGADKKLLRSNGVTLLSATEQLGINADGSENLGGILTEGLLVAMAKYYSRELSKKIRRGQIESLAKKNYLGGAKLFGYYVDEMKYLVREDQAEVVRSVFEMYSKGWTAADIVSYLNEKGIRNSAGRPFVQNSIMNMLKNKKYIGTFIYGGRVFEDYLPPIVDKTVFDTVQERIEQNKRNPARLKAKEIYLLSGKLYCGYCKKVMTGESVTSRTGEIYHYYKCFSKKKKHQCEKKSVRKSFIEDLVISQTLKHILNSSVIEEISAEILSFQEDSRKTSELSMLKGDLAQINAQIKNIIDAIKQGLLTPSTQSELLSLEERKATLQEKITMQEYLEDEPLTQDHIQFWFEQFTHFDYDDEGARAYLITYFINRVILYDDKVIIIYNHHGDNRTLLDTNEIESALGSDLTQDSPPKSHNPNLIITKNFVALIIGL